MHSLAIMSLLDVRQHLFVSKLSKMLVRDDLPGPSDSSTSADPSDSHSSLSDEEFYERSQEMKTYANTVASLLYASKDPVSQRMLKLLHTMNTNDRAKRSKLSETLTKTQNFTAAFNCNQRDIERPKQDVEEEQESVRVLALTQLLGVSSSRPE